MNSFFNYFEKDKDTKDKPLKEKELRVFAERCPQNHSCPSIKVCPVNALSQNGYEAPKVDLEKCIKCGKCTHSCPMRALALQ